jgi:uncharacterized protein
LKTARNPRYLLDVNVLVALAWPSHIHHAAAHAWFKKTGSVAFATCALTQLGLMRISMNPAVVGEAVTAFNALRLSTEISMLPGHQFLAEVSPLDTTLNTIMSAALGHRQITDLFLLGLANHHHCVLATLDIRLANTSQLKQWQHAVHLISTL